jgi:hypothetical protein
VENFEEPPVNPLELQPQEAQQEKPRKDVEAIKEAQNFFQSLGISVQEGGYIEANPTDEKIVKLKNWHEATTGDLGIIMTTEQDFYRKTLLAVSLWRQQEGGKTNYLLGKGAGVEVALRGNIAGRTKRPIGFSYRSHSDFELYAVVYEAGENGANIGNQPIYSEPFNKVFGGQEYFPLTKTKGLKNIPPTLLHDTAEVVDFGGVSVRVPQLELLFLDKYMAKESTPRTEGHDYEVLARQYTLDRAKIHLYLDQLVIEPAVAQIQAQTQRDFMNQLEGIKSNIKFVLQEFEEEGVDSAPQDLIARVNQRIQSVLDIHGAESTVSHSGVRLNLWQTLAPKQVDAVGNIIDQEFLQKLQEKVKQMEASAIERYRGKHKELDQLFDSIDQEFATERKTE